MGIDKNNFPYVNPGIFIVFSLIFTKLLITNSIINNYIMKLKIVIRVKEEYVKNKVIY